MEEEKIARLGRHIPGLIGMKDCARAAVCLPLLPTPDGYELLFEVRSARLSHQPGDVCFPGGMLEEGETPAEAALRELGEELLTAPGQARLLGLMDVMYSGHGLMTYPYAVLLSDYRRTYSQDEVEEVFTVPLSFFLETEPEIYYTRTEVIPEENFPFEWIAGGRAYPWRKRREAVYFYQYQDHTIWGMTAKLTASFITIWKEMMYQ